MTKHSTCTSFSMTASCYALHWLNPCCINLLCHSEPQRQGVMILLDFPGTCMLPLNLSPQLLCVWSLSLQEDSISLSWGTQAWVCIFYLLLQIKWWREERCQAGDHVPVTSPRRAGHCAPVTNPRAGHQASLPTASWHQSHQGKQHSQALGAAVLYLHREHTKQEQHQ